MGLHVIVMRGHVNVLSWSVVGTALRLIRSWGYELSRIILYKIEYQQKELFKLEKRKMTIQHPLSTGCPISKQN